MDRFNVAASDGGSYGQYQPIKSLSARGALRSDDSGDYSTAFAGVLGEGF